MTKPYIPPRRIGKYVQDELFQRPPPVKRLRMTERDKLLARLQRARDAIAKLKPFLYEREMTGETEYEVAVLELWQVERELSLDIVTD